MLNLSSIKEFIKIFNDLISFSFSNKEKNDYNIKNQNLISEIIQKSLIIFFENLSLDNKIKFSLDIFNKFKENSKLEKIKKIKNLIIYQNFKTLLITKNKHFNKWKYYCENFNKVKNENQIFVSTIKKSKRFALQ